MRNFMTLEEKVAQLLLYGPTACLVKEKGAIVPLRFMTLLSQPRHHVSGAFLSYWWWFVPAEGAIR
jgi:hypothetical protein